MVSENIEEAQDMSWMFVTLLVQDQGQAVMEMTDVFELMEHRLMTSVVVYIAENEGCCKTDVYKRFDAVHTVMERIGELADEGYVEVRASELGAWNRKCLYLTPRGVRLASALQGIRDDLGTGE